MAIDLEPVSLAEAGIDDELPRRTARPSPRTLCPRRASISSARNSRRSPMTAVSRSMRSAARPECVRIDGSGGADRSDRSRARRGSDPPHGRRRASRAVGARFAPPSRSSTMKTARMREGVAEAHRGSNRATRVSAKSARGFPIVPCCVFRSRDATWASLATRKRRGSASAERPARLRDDPPNRGRAEMARPLSSKPRRAH